MIALIDTVPNNSRNKATINLGYEIASKSLSAEKLYWRFISKKNYDVYAFNIFYPTHIFNMLSFLRKNNIPLLKDGRSQYVVVGGQGVSNLNGCLDNIVNETYKGEVDGDKLENGWNRLSNINTEHVTKGENTLIELTRGCKYRCKFCEYGWVHGGKYREKDIDTVKKDIDIATFYGHDRRANFLSANLGSYSHLDELMEYARGIGTYITNTDVCLKDFEKAKNHLLNRQTIKVGLESFDESTRVRMAKAYPNDKLMEFFDWAMNNVGSIHCYLIYGLPEDNYESWFNWVRLLGSMRRSVAKPVRIEYSITNFEPCIGTPLQDAPMVDFEKKEQFIKEWTETLKEAGFRNGEKEITYANGRGRLGRKKYSYEMLMRLKRAGPEITGALINSFKMGIGRTISDEEALKFLEAE